jgi:malonyl-CoA O-methyltransferase
VPEAVTGVEYLPASGVARQELLLLHGWGSDREVWRPLLAGLRDWANVTLVDWQPPAGTLEDALARLVAEILAVAPARAVCLGWSLGGQVATALAAAAPRRVAGLVTLASNPHFCAGPNWPGLPADSLQGFRDTLQARPAQARRRFDALQASGAGNPRALLRQLAGLGGRHSDACLARGLDWLARLDTRPQLARLDIPQLHLLVDADALLPTALQPALASLLADNAAAEVQSLGPACHAAPLEIAPAIARALREFVAARLPRQATVTAACPVAKRDIAASFSRAAQHYDSVAALQRDVGERLLTLLDREALSPATVLDLGCGTGYCQPRLQTRFSGARYLGMDIAAGMLDYARARHPGAANWVVGDAEALPLAAASQALVYSSLAFQWCYRPELLFAELARVLQPGGLCLFTSLGPATLQELRTAWAAVDAGRHVNSFIPGETLRQAAKRLPGVRLDWHAERVVMRYPRVGDLLGELKTLGAHNMNSGRAGGLTSRRQLAGMVQAYEQYRDPAGLPATYEVIFGRLEKQ